MRKSICICADDFGLCFAVNQAIIQLIQLKIVSATSCMVFAKDCLKGAKVLNHIKNDYAFDIGLHVDFTQTCHLNMPFKWGANALPKLILNAYVRTLNKKELSVKIHAQFEQFEKIFHQTPDYIDGHQHVHQLPMIRDVLCEIIQQRYMGNKKKPMLRSTRDRYNFTNLKASVIYFLGGAALVKLSKKHGISLNNCLLGVYDFNLDEDAYYKKLIQWLFLSKSGDMIMCHPGMNTHSMHAFSESSDGILDTIAQARFIEFSVLSNPKLPDTLKKLNIDIVPFTHLIL